MNIEALAKQLYDGCQTPKPHWDDLGDVTKSVWRERARLHQARGAARPPTVVEPSPITRADTPQGDLF